MNLKAAELLTRLADQERERLERSLAENTEQRMRLQREIAACRAAAQHLRLQRERMLNGLSNAATLLAFTEALDEQDRIAEELTRQLRELDRAREGIRSSLARALRTHRAYARAWRNEQKRAERKLARREQAALDEMFAARMKASAA